MLSTFSLPRPLGQQTKSIALYIDRHSNDAIVVQLFHLVQSEEVEGAR